MLISRCCNSCIVLHWCTVPTFLQQTSNTIVHQVQVWAVRWTHIGRDEVGGLAPEQVDGLMCRRNVLLKHVNFAGDVADGHSDNEVRWTTDVKFSQSSVYQKALQPVDF